MQSFNYIALFSFAQKALSIILIGLLTYLINKLLTKYINKKRIANIGHYTFIINCLKTIIYFVGSCLCISIFSSLKSIAFSALASSGIVALVIGFASQQAISNIISGFFLAIYKPFALGDYIKVRNISGMVQDITFLHTIIKTQDNKFILIPNSIINSEIIENDAWTDNGF